MKTEETLKSSEKKVKCLVWDLDNTLWDGVLLEDDNVELREGVTDIIKELDRRGILLSIASKNSHEDAWEKVKELQLDEYFIYPQINWNSKSSSITKIAESINVGIDTFAFIDDQPFELEEVASVHPDVICINASKLDDLLDMPEMTPRFITKDSKMRRLMYKSEAKRKETEEEFVGTQEEYLASLNMELSIAPAEEDDLQRAEELTVRTNQLNTTGYVYSYDELNKLRKSDKHKLLMAELNDRFGTYGKIGLALIECEEVDKLDEIVIFEHQLENILSFPEYVDLKISG
ncbi:MAG: HAD-IIIC family phosphatase [Halanaerobiales bacterium]|nr:HAD-IIIC family phosphatase [Halanaerobiales bacterium]